MFEVPTFIIRFGKSEPTIGDMAAVTKLREDLNIMGTGTPMGILNLLMTDKSPEEIINIYQAAAEETEDILPIIVFRADVPEAVAMDLTLPNVAEMIETFEQMHGITLFKEGKQQCQLTLDQLLDKISRTGMQSLTEEEVARLKSLG